MSGHPRGHRTPGSCGGAVTDRSSPDEVGWWSTNGKGRTHRARGCGSGLTRVASRHEGGVEEVVTELAAGGEVLHPK
jgi:hypothetical protein